MGRYERLLAETQPFRQDANLNPTPLTLGDCNGVGAAVVSAPHLIRGSSRFCELRGTVFLILSVPIFNISFLHILHLYYLYTCYGVSLEIVSSSVDCTIVDATKSLTETSPRFNLGDHDCCVCVFAFQP